MCIKFKSSFSSKIATVLQESRTLLSSYTKKTPKTAQSTEDGGTHIRITDLFRFISSSVIYSFLRTPLNEAYCLKPPPNKQGTAGRIDGDATSTRSTVLETPETWKVWAIFTLYCPCDLLGLLGMVKSFIYSSVELS